MTNKKYIFPRCLRAVAVVFALCVCGAVSGQVTVDVKIDSLELFVGQQTRLTLDVSAGAGSSIVMPMLEEGSVLTPGVEVVEVAKADTEMLNEGARVFISRSYIITSFDSALYYLPPLEVLVDSELYQSNSLALRVLSFEVDTLHLDQFFPPKEIMSLSFVWDDWKGVVWLSVLMLVLVAALVYLAVRYGDNKPLIRIVRPLPKILPHAAAMQQIEQIKAERSWAKEDSKEYYTRLTEILRTYIEKRYGFNAMEMTSGEIIECLLREQSRESLQELCMLFQTADLVKFAKHSTLINENDMNLVNAIDFINQTKREEEVESKPEPDIQTVEQQRSRRVVLAMRVALGVLAVAVVALLCRVVWLVYLLVA